MANVPWTADTSEVTADTSHADASGSLGTSIRVQAVSNGWYGGAYYQPGDVFDLVSSADYSDSTQNYQSEGGEYAPGWMLQVTSATPLYQALAAEPTPLFPINPGMRTVM